MSFRHLELCLRGSKRITDVAPQLKQGSHKSGQWRTGAGLPELLCRVDADRAGKPLELNSRSRQPVLLVVEHLS